MAISLKRMSPHAFSDLPEGLLSQGRASPDLLLDLASDGVYIAHIVTDMPVVSYTAISPLPGVFPVGMYGISADITRKAKALWVLPSTTPADITRKAKAFLVIPGIRQVRPRS